MIFPDIELEKELWKKGFKYIAGIDEAGRGPLAGPVSAGAVVINPSLELCKLVRDSKKMTAKHRDEAYEYIVNNSLGYGVSLVSNEDVDKLGIQHAVRKAMEEALRQVEDMLKSRVDYLIIDGANVLSLDNYSQSKINSGDLKHYSISCGSILAKVTRDRYMVEMSTKYPEYGFDHNVGYGTKEHLEAISKYGSCPIHRMSFAPLSKLPVS